MKFDELKETCEKVTEPVEGEFSLYPTPNFILNKPLSERGKVKCKQPDCDYWPWNSDWLDKQGYCTLCASRNRRRKESEEAFAPAPGMCMRCGEEFHNLHSSGYCLQCRVILEEMGVEQAAGIAPSPEKTTTRVLPRMPRDASKHSRYGTYWCYNCYQFMAKNIGERCPTCAENGLLLFPCRLCRQPKAYVVGGTCTSCARTLADAHKGVDPNLPQIVSYTPTKEGGWIERRTNILPQPACLKGTEVTPSDAGLGATEDC